MMCRFHNGAPLEALSPWRLFEDQRTSCVQCARTVFCNAGGLTTVSSSCAYPNSGCQGGGIGGGGGVELLRRQIAETWPIFIPLPPSSASYYSTDRRGWPKGSPPKSGASSSETGTRIGRANPMPFSISNILGRQAAAAAAAASEDRKQQTSQRKIVRPWDDDDKVSFNDRSRSKHLRKSSTEIDDSDDEEEEEEINVGQRRLESTGDNDCPLDALLRMTSGKQFERLDTAASGYTSDGRSSFHPMCIECVLRSNIYIVYWIDMSLFV